MSHLDLYKDGHFGINSDKPWVHCQGADAQKSSQSTKNHHLEDWAKEGNPRNLVNSGYSASHSTVYRYLKDTINVYPYKRPRIPRLTEKMKQNRLDFSLKRKNLTIADWEKIMWSDEPPFQLFAPPNR